MADEEPAPPASEEKPQEAPPAEAPKDEVAKPPEPARPPVPAQPSDEPAQGKSIEKLVKGSQMNVGSTQAGTGAMGEEQRERGEKYEKKAKEVVGELIEVRRGSFVDATGVPKVAKFLNTYKMEPDKPFNPERVYKILEPIMSEAFEHFTAFKHDEEGELTNEKYFLPYHPEMCAQQAKWISETVRTKIKEMEFDRYKIISICTIGEKNNQDIYTCSRFLWDYEKDNWAKWTMENPYIFGYILIFALYYE